MLKKLPKPTMDDPDASMMSESSLFQQSSTGDSPNGYDSMSYKAQKKMYKSVKKSRKTMYNDDDEVLKQGMLKVRSRLKNWHKFYAVLHPGRLVIYKENKSDWVATVLLYGGNCQERPTRKSGFSFKYYNPQNSHILASKGPKGESFFNFYILPHDACIFRCATDEGLAWVTAMEEAKSAVGDIERRNSLSTLDSPTQPHASLNQPDFGGGDIANLDITPQQIVQHRAVPETLYTPLSRPIYSKPGAEQQRSTIPAKMLKALWNELGKVKPGENIPIRSMPLPLTSPRPMLDALTDQFGFGYLLQAAGKEQDKVIRLIGVARWLLASLTCRGDGSKFPLCGVKGEVFRCAFNSNDSNAVSNRTFVIAEQIDSEPATSAVFATNREAGWVVGGSQKPQITFQGNVIKVKSNAHYRVTLLNTVEQYFISLPDTIVRGLLLGRIAKELVGEATISCAETKNSMKINFLLNDHFEADGEGANRISGSLFQDDQVQGTLEGNWDRSVIFKPTTDSNVPETTVFQNDDALRAQCGKKSIVAKDQLFSPGSKAGFFDSSVIWGTIGRNLTPAAIASAHRTASPAAPKFFSMEELTDADEDWQYKHLDLRPWNPATGDFFISSNDGLVSVLSKDDLQHVIQKVASISSSTPSTPGVAKSKVSKSVSRRTSAIRLQSGPASPGFSPINEEVDVDVLQNITRENQMLLKRVEILEARQKMMYKINLPLLLILFFVMQILVAQLPYLFSLDGLI